MPRLIAYVALLSGLTATLGGCSAASKDAVEQSRRGPVAPQAMPSLNLTDASGKSWGPDQFNGKTVLVEFWATWCAPCREVAPELRTFASKRSKTVTLLSISLDNDEAAFKRFVREHPVQHAVAFGGPSLAKPWNVTQMPALVLVRDGRILARWQGKEAFRDGLRIIVED